MNSGDPILDALADIPGLHPGTRAPSEEHLAAICCLTTRSLTRVRPLPSRATLFAIALTTFVALSALAAIPVGLRGYLRLSPGDRLVYFAVILCAAAMLSSALVAEILPGSRRAIPPALSVILPPLALLIVTVVLFPHGEFARFLHGGGSCLQIGIVSAAAAGLLVCVLVRAGFATSALRTAVTAGLLAGVTGFAVLAIHCPILNVTHILVWHFPALIAAALAATLIALSRHRTLRVAK